MNNIFTLLRDPTWWFTAVIAGTIVGVISAYIKDLFGCMLGFFSSKLKTKLIKEITKENVTISFYSSCTQNLTLLYAKCILLWVVLTSVITMAIIIFSTVSLRLQAKPVYKIYTETEVANINFLLFTAMALVCAFILIEIMAINSSILAYRCFRAYKRKHFPPEVR